MLDGGYWMPDRQGVRRLIGLFGVLLSFLISQFIFSSFPAFFSWLPGFLVS